MNSPETDLFKKYKSSLLTLMLFSLFCSSTLVAENSEKTSNETKEKKLSLITVSGGKDSSNVEGQIPGSAHYLNSEKINKTSGVVNDIHRTLANIPGVNITDEEGYGLRPNIGFRGTDTERSASITLMEDGILIAPAPYAAPSAYYFPTFGRMEGLEVVKGAGQIEYGPRTTGGSLNLISASIPEDLKTKGSFRFGTNNLKIGDVKFGDSYKYGGWMFQTYQADTDGFKDLDGGGDTGYQLEDYLAKFKVNTSADSEYYQELELKLQRSDQDSDETYLGITDEDFNATPNRRYSASQLDNIDVTHKQIALTHYGDFKDFDISTTFYRNETARNWYKLQSVNGVGLGSIFNDQVSFAQELDFLRGADTPDDAITLRANNRKYLSKGIQSTLASDLDFAGAEHHLKFGVRLHEDYEDRFQQEDDYRSDNGTLVLTSAGAPGSNANRRSSAQAVATFLKDEIVIDNLTLIPGIRFESINFKRTEWDTADTNRSNGATVNRNSTDVWIPGLGASYSVNPNLRVFGGVHKGFSPPGPSKDPEIEEETSINYEAGVGGNGDSWKSEAVFFYSDYDNLLGADTASSGGEGSGDFFNAGESRALGLEWSGEVNLAGNDSSFGIPLRATYTYTNSEFRSNFDSELFGLVQSGDRIPYIPEHQALASIGYEDKKFAINLSGRFMDSVATAPAQAGVRDTNPTDSFITVDLNTEYNLDEEGKFKLFGVVDNIFDEEYIVARRPAGARPGRPLTAVAGIKFSM